MTKKRHKTKNKNRTCKNKTKNRTYKKSGGKADCANKCKTKFLKEIKKDKRYKRMENIFSLLGMQNILDDEAKSVLNSKEITNDKVFKDCVQTCKKE